MAPTVLILANGLMRDELARWLGPAAPRFSASFLADTAAVAGSLRDVHVVVCYTPQFPREALARVERELEVTPIIGSDGPALAGALAGALAAGEPAVLIGADLPHLPPWRLRDALTHLEHGADVVLGPTDQGDWYLVGLRTAEPDLLRLIPARGEPAQGLAHAASAAGRRLAVLPPWFTVRTGVGLAALAELLRTMPAEVAAETRALLDAGTGSARAVGG